MDTQIQSIVDTQNEIIGIQSEIIDALFVRLCRYMSANEIAEIPTVDKISEVARKMDDLRGVVR